MRAVNGSRLSADRTFLSASVVPHQKLRKFHEVEWSAWTNFHLWSTVKGQWHSLLSKVKTLHKQDHYFHFSGHEAPPTTLFDITGLKSYLLWKENGKLSPTQVTMPFKSARLNDDTVPQLSKKIHGKLLMTQFATLLHSWVSRTKLAALKHSKVSLTQVATPVRFYYFFVDQKKERKKRKISL